MDLVTSHYYLIAFNN